MLNDEEIKFLKELVRDEGDCRHDEIEDGVNYCATCKVKASGCCLLSGICRNQESYRRADMIRMAGAKAILYDDIIAALEPFNEAIKKAGGMI